MASTDNVDRTTIYLIDHAREAMNAQVSAQIAAARQELHTQNPSASPQQVLFHLAFESGIRYSLGVLQDSNLHPPCEFPHPDCGVCCLRRDIANVMPYVADSI